MAPLDGNVVLFGGDIGGPGSGSGIGDLSDTWIWNGTKWSHLNVSGVSSVYAPSMAPLNGQLVLLAENDVSQAPLMATWNGSVWRRLREQPDAWGNMAPLGSQLVLVGYGSPPNRSVTATWNGARWTDLHVPGPSRRSDVAMAPLDGKLVLFGGEDQTSTSTAECLADTWTWDGATWTQLHIPGPPGRCGGLMVPLDGKLVLFGGQDNTIHLPRETWLFDGATWTVLDVKGPSGRINTAMSAGE